MTTIWSRHSSRTDPMSRSIWPFSHAASRQKDKATAALGIPTLDGLGADGKGAHAAYEQIYFSSLMPRTYLCARLLETLD
jgi:hypothetical protein